MNEPIERELLSQKEICAYLGISPKTFARNKIGDKLRTYKVGKRIKYRKEDVDRLRLKGLYG